jgi:hypothetical protein
MRDVPHNRLVEERVAVRLGDERERRIGAYDGVELLVVYVEWLRLELLERVPRRDELLW